MAITTRSIEEIIRNRASTDLRFKINSKFEKATNALRSAGLYEKYRSVLREMEVALHAASVEKAQQEAIEAFVEKVSNGGQ